MGGAVHVKEFLLIRARNVLWTGMSYVSWLKLLIGDRFLMIL